MSSTIAIHKEIQVKLALYVLFIITWHISKVHYTAISQIRLYSMTQSSQWLTSEPFLSEARGSVWPAGWLHGPLVMFVVLISMPIIYESATGYGRTGAQGGLVAYASSAE